MTTYGISVGLVLTLLGLVGAVAVPGSGSAQALGSAGPGRSSYAPEPVARFRWPVDGPPRVVRRFDPPPQPWSPGHRGVDLAATPGSVVRAAGAGVVLFAGRIAGRGVVSVSHPGGLRTTYEPVEPAVVSGERLGVGDPIGALVAGHRGCPASACLHWGLRRGEHYLDPLTLLGLGRVRLLPAREARPRLSSPWLRSARPGGPAGGGPGCRTPRRGCRPARTVAASRARPTR